MFLQVWLYYWKIVLVTVVCDDSKDCQIMAYIGCGIIAAKMLIKNW